MRDRFLAAGILLAIGLTGSAHGAHPALGEPVPQSSVTAADITVMPDGTGLPPGSGSAVGGRAIYLAQCAQCHGPDGNAGPNDRLVGGRGSLGSDQPVKTVGSYWPYATTLFDYIHRAMPYQAPG